MTMMKFRTFLHKESCNVFSSIKFVEFNNIRQNFKLVTLFKLCMLFESSSTLRHSSDESPVKSVFIMQIPPPLSSVKNVGKPLCPFSKHLRDLPNNIISDRHTYTVLPF